jgi:cell division topological specificity factor
MNIFDFFRSARPKSASVAKERLKIILAQERTEGDAPEFLPLLQRELLEVVRKYVQVDGDAVRIQFDHAGQYDVLELNIQLPDGVQQKARVTQ